MGLEEGMVCSPGFDCQFYASCPNYLVDCPRGFFCSSYENSTYKQELDEAYKEVANLYARKKAKAPAIDKDRAFQFQCLPGFYCPTPSTMLPCPSGHWCPSSTFKPHPCDFLSFCGERASYQMNFVNFLIMGILLIITMVVSSWLISSQQRANKSSQKVDHHQRRYLSLPTTEDAQQALNEFQSSSIAISFKNLYLEYPSRNNADVPHVVLPNISGEIPAGKITGILGPTSCGKSSLLKILKNGGQAPASSLSADQMNNTQSRDGVVDITIKNFQTGNQWKLQSFNLSANFIGYVPQEDIFDRELTVRELFTFHALIKLANSHKTYKDILIIVDEVLSELGIQHIADAIIGGDENKAANISGGQLKRVNIGCELVSLTKPSLLLLDEPTAGLDANIAYELILTLEQLCKNKGITIVVVLQQPRNEIFQRLEHLFLMNTQGGIVFEGKSSDAAGYLCSLGYSHTTDETSDADFCLDVLNGLLDYRLPQRTEEHDSTSIPRTADHLHFVWDEKVRGLTSSELESGTNNSEGNPIMNSAEVIDSSNSHKFDLLDENQDHLQSYYGYSFHHLKKFCFFLWLNAKRLILIRFRNRNALLLYIFINLLMACALSSGFSILITNNYLGTYRPPVQKSFQGFYPRGLGQMRRESAFYMAMTQLCFFMSSALGAAAALASVPVFAGKLTTFQREKSSGMNLFAYLLGRMIGDVYFVLLNAFVFAGVWCCFGHAGSFSDWMATILSTSFAASGIGYVAGTSVNKNSSNVVAIIVSFVFCVFAGVEPTLAQVSRYPVVSWPWYISYATWTSEATFYTWTKYLTDDNKIDISLQDAADHFGWDVSNGLGRSIGALIGLGIALRIVAMIFLWWKSR